MCKRSRCLTSEHISQKKKTKRPLLITLALLLAVCILAGVLAYNYMQSVQHTASTFVMDTLATQTAYGPKAERAMRDVNAALAAFDNRLTMYGADGDIARINVAAGSGGAEVSDETVALLQKGLALSAQSEGAFALTIAPITLAWGVTSGQPRVPAQSEIDALLPLVNDEDVQIEGNRVALARAGMGLDLGGLAKGEACNLARDIYEEYGVRSALLSIGGSSIYARGTKPDGTPWRVGFRDPNVGEGAYMASFTLTDMALGVSGGYERFFEVDGKAYIHIFDPRTGQPAQSDIVSVGAVHEDGAAADFWATTLFIWGKDRTLQYMRQGGAAIFVDEAGTLYVSESLRDGFELHEQAGVAYTVEYVAGG